MKKTALLIVVSLFITTLSGCSNFKAFMESNGLFSSEGINPLKSSNDNSIEKLIVGGKWLYQRQTDDCADTYWAQHFYKSGYYKSGGASCLLSDSFSIDAENWHIKDQMLYVLNLSPKEGEDIILKYGIKMSGRNMMTLRSSTDTYTFIRSWKK